MIDTVTVLWKIFWWNPLPAGNFFYENTVIKSYLATSRILKSNLATSLRKYFIKWADNILTIADQSGKLSKCSNVEDFTFKLWIAPRWFPAKALSWWYRRYLLRYESSTLILYKKLSSTIFQSLWVSESGIGNICPDLHFVQYIKA